QDAVVAHHVHARRRDEGADAGQQIEGLELDGGGAVLPGALEAVADAAVVEVLEAFLGDGGTGQIAAEALDLGVVGAVEGAGGVDVEALDDGDGLVGAGLAGIDEAQGGLAGAGAEEAEALGRGGAADGPAAYETSDLRRNRAMATTWASHTTPQKPRIHQSMPIRSPVEIVGRLGRPSPSR